jgi:hypothetical protein
MAVQHIINVDLARVYESENKKGFVRTLEWGDGVEVKNITEEHVEIVTVKHQKQDDGMIKPVPASGFIVPSKSSGIKPDRRRRYPAIRPLPREPLPREQQRRA